MRSWIRGSVLFAAGLLLGMVTIKSIDAQQDKGIGLRVNHVGIYVKNMQESLDFYTKTLGMREGFVMRDRNGNPTTHYIQVDKYTFLELSQATADRPAGMNHIGFQTDNINDTMAELKKRSVMVPDATSVGSGAPHTSINDPNGVRLEMREFAEGSMQRKNRKPTASRRDAPKDSKSGTVRGSVTLLASTASNAEGIISIGSASGGNRRSCSLSRATQGVVYATT